MASDSVVLPPHYGVSLGLVTAGLACLILLPIWGGALWLALVISLLGLVLVLQTALLRLEFGPGALLVRRQETLLRRFPYDEWLGWTVFWPKFPFLFYFREQRSIHLLPMLFNAGALHDQLHLHLKHLATNDG